MATLVIHPEDDSSTSFLKQIYEDIPSRVITKNLPKNELIDAVKKANNVIILGHGDKNGLFNTYVDSNANSKYIIDTNFAKLLEHKNCLLIWCHANDFVTYNKIYFNGISTGMFVSQQNELICLDENFEFEQEIEAYQPMIDESNTAFVSILGKLLKDNRFDNLHSIYEKLKLDYKVIAQRNEIACYNHSRIFFNNPK